ncbi:Tfp pilus assembly protein tip-associated adhesin PilY1-like protein [uncultured Desulfobacterium sp.]|uniref:Tfp pilus assembly protein tip-associated adhesin PilY1-like protein n=1 Tax=uncultured Desulfobacterium sp. TaxID=201089 RepID=A0A445N3K7_9BACT|nr:Tfp pilus assembly protein tip-associated adhesin PilY1-like protein [uncultured Desulfobacterium sp.]
MKIIRKYKPFILSITFLFILSGLIPQNANSLGSDYCGIGAATPPFLSAGVDPNLLLLIDNSGSMLDLAYIDTNSNCFDNTYNTATTYAGYFETDGWYGYNLISGRFEKLTDAQRLAYIAAASYKNSDVTISGIVSGGALISVSQFGGRGNFLNWAMASKLDIQKKILTGGKYDAATQQLIMECRGCGERRFVKSVAVTDSGGVVNYLTLGIRPPRPQEFDPWANGTAYVVGSIVSYWGDLYRATTAGTSNGTGPDNDTGVSWALYYGTEWHNGTTYPAGSIVTDPSKTNTLDEGRMYITATGGTANGTGVDNDTGITDWETYDLTQIEIFKVNTTGFNNVPCDNAVTEMGSTNPTLGQISQDIDSCMGYTSGGQNTIAGYSNAAFNQSVQNCWYWAKHDTWNAQGQQATQNACERLYTDTTSPIMPWDITPDDTAYVCYGVYNADPANQHGYVGRCWHPGAGATYQCIKYKKDGSCQQWGYVGGTDPHWDAAGYASVDACINQALMDYCGDMSIPEVIDPSDQVGDAPATTDTFWNIPAVLIDSGVVAQLDQPLVVLKGRILEPTAPTGLIEEFADDIRMGAMVFNKEGSKSECTQPDPYVLYNCANASNRDGGEIISEIDQSDAHTTALISAINDIKANSWTPIAEAFYNAIGYYTQNPSNLLRLDANDFQTGDDHYPITAYCQDNNVLIITEGASTADLNPIVADFIDTDGRNDTDSNDSVTCGVLSGSPYLDDLTYYAHNSPNLHELLMNDETKKNITTHIVVAGTLRSTGTNECSPDVLLENAAENGGTELYTASDPAQLEDTLREAFYKIRAGAAAGSAASVISSSRGGEGATYQAIFWPEIDLPSGGSVKWTGEVHSLLVDSQGLLHEDTNNNNALDPLTDERVIFYYDEETGETMACYGTLNSDGTCNGTSKAMHEVHYLWSAAEWLANIAPTASNADQDILVNRSSYMSTEKKRYIFTWNDLDNDGIVDNDEKLVFDTTNTDWAALAPSSRGSVTLDFGVRTIAEVEEIIDWVRGLDQEGQRSRQMPYDFDHDGVDTNVTWRLGDVVHSTPMSVSSPSEGFHMLYRDSSYAAFAAQYKHRRHMIYFGGNDGMLHAVNGGFYDEAYNRFCRNAACTDEGAIPNSSPELGAEMWAYVPYNILPHLKCLREEGYVHKYYVDQRVRVFDVRIFDPNDGIHTNGWGTILVGAMGFGGAKIQAGTLDLDGAGGADSPTDNREFTSSYFIFDITNPEAPPVLLGETTKTTNGGDVDFGFTKAIPTMVTMTNGLNVNDTTWYLIMGSGPTELDGKSTQNARLAVLPLNWLMSGSQRALRIPDAVPSVANSEGGCFTLSDANSFISDLITVDFDLNVNYKGDAVYFGTVSGTWGDWGGKLYRLVTRDLDAGGNQIVTTPSDWQSLINPLSNPLPLIDVGKPVTAGATVGYDGTNFWVFFGTGRFFDGNDKSDISSNAQQTYYGIKEPMTFTLDDSRCTGSFTWSQVEVLPTEGDNTPGGQGLVDVSDIRVRYRTGLLSCADGTTNCLPLGVTGTPITTFNELTDYIAGTGIRCNEGSSIGKDGWYKDFYEPRERNLGQGTLLGGLLSFTTYQPYNDVCLPEGLAYLYGLYYKTGTAYYPDVFGRGPDNEDNVTDHVDLGRGMATTPNLHVGKHKGSKAFVQTSTGAIVEVDQPGTPENPGTGLTGWTDE